MKDRQADVLALLMMPPPVHGASVINQRMVDKLEKCGVVVKVINTVPSRHARFFGGAVWKLLRVFLIIRVFFKILFFYRFPPPIVYIGISGGVGLIFDYILALAVRCLKVPVVIHHHSFAYVSKHSILFNKFCALLRKVPVTHVVLCSEMGDQLCGRYPALITQDQVHVVSNAAFFEGYTEAAEKLKEQKALHVGYISNITSEKGIQDVLALFTRCLEAGLPVEMTVAGPCADESIITELKTLSAGEKSFNYIGAVYGEDKHNFFQMLDILVFPTRYANEAEPLVIYEAAEQGIPTIANARGCIASMVTHCGGWAIENESLFVNEAVSLLSSLLDETDRKERRHLALIGSRDLRGNSQSSLAELLNKMGGGYVAAS